MNVPDNLLFSLFVEQDARIKKGYRKKLWMSPREGE